jgi:hypothetical protein
MTPKKFPARTLFEEKTKKLTKSLTISQSLKEIKKKPTSMTFF